ncbi:MULTISPECIES: hypothetical protein [Dickeya]|uniref:hypothetical protein n=1 Tax=Dickeya TaxID=204037 RepID=UPI0003A8295A|nr:MULTISPECIES: hypothetical protein [Dickeya]WKV49340.1 hypothetical protein PL145_15440 [Dickeya fangzhongdai]
MHTPADMTPKDAIDLLLSETNIINYLHLVASMNHYLYQQKIQALSSQEFGFLATRLKRIKIDVNQLAELSDRDKTRLREACHDIIQFIENR